MAKYDLESLINDLKAVCVAQLNSKLSAINTEKADGLDVPPVSEDAYFFQSLAKSAAGQYPVFIFYGAEDPTVDSIGAATLEAHSVDFIVVVREMADDKMSTRMLRYSRAMKEIFEQAFLQRKIGTKIEVISLTPTRFGIEGIKHNFHGVGVKIGAVIG